MQSYDNGGAAAGVALSIILALVYMAVVVLLVASMWKVFVKAGKPGWAAIVPIYNLIVLLEIVGKPTWWIVLFLIPCVGIVAALLMQVELAKSFGKDVGFAIGLILLPMVFLPLLAFGSAQYQGPSAMARTA